MKHHSLDNNANGNNNRIQFFWRSWRRATRNSPFETSKKGWWYTWRAMKQNPALAGKCLLPPGLLKEPGMREISKGKGSKTGRTLHFIALSSCRHKLTRKLRDWKLKAALKKSIPWHKIAQEVETIGPRSGPLYNATRSWNVVCQKKNKEGA